MSSPPLPALRTVAGWWASLAPFSPTALLAGWLTVLRAEVLVESSVTAPLDPITTAVLAAVASLEGATAASIDHILRLGEPRVHSALMAACRHGYTVEQPTTGPARFALTGSGRGVLDHGVRSPVRSRRRFAFRDGHFVPLADPGPLLVGGTQATLLGVGPGPRLVADAIAHPAPWGADARFPDDFEQVCTAEGLPAAERWRAVPAEQLEEFPAVVVSTRAGESQGVVGFTTSAPDWPLLPAPMFELRGGAAAAAFPELFGPPPEGDVRAAWVSWAKSRAVPLDRADAAGVALEGYKLAVTVAAGFGEWLRANRADVFAGGTWVWVGEGDVRRAAVLDVRG